MSAVAEIGLLGFSGAAFVDNGNGVADIVSAAVELFAAEGNPGIGKAPEGQLLGMGELGSLTDAGRGNGPDISRPMGRLR